MSQLTHAVLVQFARPFHNACYSKLNQREHTIVDLLVGLDYLVVNGNKITVRQLVWLT